MQALDRLRQPLDRFDQVVAVGLLLELEPEVSQLTRQELGLGQ